VKVEKPSPLSRRSETKTDCRVDLSRRLAASKYNDDGNSMKAEVKRRRIVTPPSSQLRKRAWPRDVVLRGFTPSSDYFDEIRQFLPGIEVYPFAGRVIIIGQTTISLALNPYQVLVIWNPPAGFIIFRV
jgi:hypothetical protein